MKKTVFLILLSMMICVAPAVHAAIATFDDLSLASESYWNGADGSGFFISGDTGFSNGHNPDWGSWDGWAYSNMTDTTTAGYTNQFSAITGVGAGGSANYGIAYDAGEWGMANPPTASFGASTGEDYNTTISGAWFTNTTYAYLSMFYGDSFVTAFGAGDYQKMIIRGIDSNANYTASTVEFYLADYTSANPDDWYIRDEWSWVDMTALGNIVGFEIDFDGSQVVNVPAYVAMDNLNEASVPVPSSLFLLAGGFLWLIKIKKGRTV